MLSIILAEREGFEPSRGFLPPNDLANRPLQPAWVPLRGGRGGIRTHEPLRAGGFQDRCTRPDYATLPLNYGI
jgi:hypothetical protein